jgi:UDP-N-acetyl-D-mannosaminuronate dehydrogenase
VLAWDPLVDPERIASYGFAPVEGGVPEGVALAVILTDHDGFDYRAIAAAVPVVFDARGAFSRRGLAADNVVAL